MSKLSNLLQKYTSNIPRYTSYPTVPNWKVPPNEEEWVASLDKHSKESPFALYLHIPFCFKLCSFCACNKIITNNAELVKQNLHSIIKELELYRLKLNKPQIKVTNLHLGGGSPTYLDEFQINWFLSEIFSKIDFTENAEISIEADPRSTNYQKLKTLKALGFNRISFGIQDFDEKVQKSINRIQPFEDVKKVVCESREIGIYDINFDLIYGLPYQNEKSISQTFEKIAILKPERIAFYNYAHIPSMFPSHNALEKIGVLNHEERHKLIVIARKMMQESGYLEVGMDHFSLPSNILHKSSMQGTLKRNFMGYSNNFSNATIAIGYSAIGDTTEYFVQNSKNLEDYQKAILENRLPINKGHTITSEEAKIRNAIVNIMTQFWAFMPTNNLNSKFEMLIEDEMILFKECKIIVTPLGHSFLRFIAGAFDESIEKLI